MKGVYLLLLLVIVATLCLPAAQVSTTDFNYTTK